MGKIKNAVKKAINNEVVLIKSDVIGYILKMIVFLIYMAAAIIIVVDTCKVDNTEKQVISADTAIVETVENNENDITESVDSNNEGTWADCGISVMGIDGMGDTEKNYDLNKDDIEMIFYMTYHQHKGNDEAEQYELDLNDAKSVLDQFEYDYPEDFEEVYQNWRAAYIDAGEPVKELVEA